MGAWDSLDDLWWLKPKAPQVLPFNGWNGPDSALGWANQRLNQQKLQQDREIRLKELEVGHYNNFLAQKKYQDQLDDQPLLNEFAMNPGGQIPHSFKSPESFHTAQQLQGLWTRSEAGRSVAAAADEYNKKLTELPAKDRIVVGDMMRQSNGIITPDVANAIDLAYENRPRDSTKFENELLSGAAKLLEQGGRNVIKTGPKGPMVDPNELSAASEEFRVKQLNTQIPSVTGMTPDVMRIKVGNGWVTLRRDAPGMTKEQFAAKNLPELMKQTQDVPSAAAALESLWGEYQKFTGAPATVPAGVDFMFQNGTIVPAK